MAKYACILMSMASVWLDRWDMGALWMALACYFAIQEIKETNSGR